jgi:hypothetical protein
MREKKEWFKLIDCEEKEEDLCFFTGLLYFYHFFLTFHGII